MKSTFRIALTFFALVWTFTLSAQDISKKQKHAINEQVEEMVDVMELNEEQKAKLMEIKTKQFVDREVLAKKYDRKSDEFKGKAKEINKATWQQITKVCTKEQLKKWREREK